MGSIPTRLSQCLENDRKFVERQRRDRLIFSYIILFAQCLEKSIFPTLTSFEPRYAMERRH